MRSWGKMSLRTALRAIAAVAAVLVACPQSCRAIDVSEVRWGFDGQVSPQHFVPLSVLITNPGAEPFDGVIELRESIGAGTSVGRPWRRRCMSPPIRAAGCSFIPSSKRTLKNGSCNGGARSGERADVTAPVFADAKPVLLVDADDFSTKGKGLRRFPENLFPPLVAATDGLKTAVLDHVPRWEERGGRRSTTGSFAEDGWTCSKGSTATFPASRPNWLNSTRRPSTSASAVARSSVTTSRSARTTRLCWNRRQDRLTSRQRTKRLPKKRRRQKEHRKKEQQQEDARQAVQRGDRETGQLRP